MLVRQTRGAHTKKIEVPPELPENTADVCFLFSFLCTPSLEKYTSCSFLAGKNLWICSLSAVQRGRPILGEQKNRTAEPLWKKMTRPPLQGLLQYSDESDKE